MFISHFWNRLALDTVVFGLVWHTLYRFTRGHHNTYHSGLIRLLVQDGERSVFCALFVIHSLLTGLVALLFYIVRIPMI